MFRGFSMKFISLAILLSINSSLALADSVLTQLPFGIKIGITKNEEVENRGVCIDRIQVSESYFRCRAYNMLNGKFYINSSQNEIVSEVMFLSASKNVLPQSWQNIGIRLAPAYLEDTDLGTSQDDFMKIIKLNNAQNINSKIIAGTVTNTKIISFDIDYLHYEAEFTYWADPTKYYGFTGLRITEAY